MMVTLILRLVQLDRLPIHLLLACQWGLLGLLGLLGSGLHQLRKLQLLHQQFLKLQQGHRHLPWMAWRLLAPVSLLIQLTLAAAVAAAVAAVRLRQRLMPAVAAAAAAVARLRLRLRLMLAAAKAVAVAVVVALLISRLCGLGKSLGAPNADSCQMVAAIAAEHLVGSVCLAGI